MYLIKRVYVQEGHSAIKGYEIKYLSPFNPTNDDDDSSNGILVGEWQECESDGVFRNDATDYEVMHMRLRADGTGDWWSVSKGKEDSHKYSFNYSGSINGTSGTITMTITSSTNSSEIGQSASQRVTYENGILHAGEIYYKKK